MADLTAGHGDALAVATQAALAAGVILRTEFHRAGGPRGSDRHHARADTEAERIIRETLLSRFPGHGYRGEETGSVPPGEGSGGHVWLVDPNDGTSAYLEGYRGFAVSIALLREGVPVVGVVYAPCFPDDRGDLLAWAEGCGPVTRNGQPVARMWPRGPDAQGTVFVSHKADKNAAANACAVAPLRFRALPSIAYRLALVAAGEGDVAVSLNSPGAWDYAGGQALLRGAGGELWDRHATSVTYTAEGDSACGGFCFGGAPQVALTLVKRDWAAALARPRLAPDPLDLCWPAPGRSVSDPGMLSRAQGCLLGQLAGDSLGGLVEFASAGSIAERYPNGVRLLADGGCWATLAGQPTDDSELALALARSLVASGSYDVEATARAYAWWYETGPFDIGTTTRRALSAASAAAASGGPAAQAAQEAADRESQANGSLMRISPLGIAGARWPGEVVVQAARLDAALTHPHPVCRNAGAVFAQAVAFAVRTGAPAREVYEDALATAARIGADDAVSEAVGAAALGPPADYSRLAGWVLIALQNAFFELLHAQTLEEGVVRTVMRGGDTDTNAAIAGALLGAVHGRDAVPEQWRDRVLTCRPIAGLPGVRHPRPRAFWPVDALCLAEQLVLTQAPQSLV